MRSKGTEGTSIHSDGEIKEDEAVLTSTLMVRSKVVVLPCLYVEQTRQWQAVGSLVILKRDQISCSTLSRVYVCICVHRGVQRCTYVVHT